MWMWLAATAWVAVFIIRGSRANSVAKELSGEFFSGTLTTDRYSGYAWVDIAYRQFCWAHLIRDFIKISERVSRVEEPRKISEKIWRRITLCPAQQKRACYGPLFCPKQTLFKSPDHLR